MGTQVEHVMSSQQLVELAERVGDELDWSSSYLNLVATSIGAVFRATDTDEQSGTITISPEAVEDYLWRLETLLKKEGKSASTFGTYSSTFRRLAEIAYEWLEKAAEGRESEFWRRGLESYRDTRVRRRTPSRSYKPALTRRSPDEDYEGRTIVLSLDYGTATLVVPTTLSATDRLTIISSILGIHDSETPLDY